MFHQIRNDVIMFVIILVLIACSGGRGGGGGSNPPADPGGTTVGPAGGTITCDDGNASATFPAGALSAEQAPMAERHGH